ncbi:MAG TPA: GTP cyclohydrolase [Hydrogenophaga sp.]|uniref:GTP cyclohydrolase I n=1 Tax=Hydrogenophaga sp. TaxID=1904254 RepID=UPI000E7ED4B6|nr:GTP cyclohydrolase I [Hydrogenophaga sp.]HAX21060.1 GTP cyclohydrolase [Hydrogenophaga sp.]HBU18967.1 GTP cyclohydrolase [Hydrogenophaga sp.]
MSKDKPDLELLQWIRNIAPEQVEVLSRQFDEKPDRITNAYKELLSAYSQETPDEIISVTEEIEDGSFNGLVSGLSIDFLSFCSHHFLPFFGSVDVLYHPGSKIIGIGKLSRLVDYRTKRFTIQEHIAKDLCEDLMLYANAKGAFAKVVAKHTCLCHRGPKKYQSKNVVTYSLGTCASGPMQFQVPSALDGK